MGVPALAFGRAEDTDYITIGPTKETYEKMVRPLVCKNCGAPLTRGTDQCEYCDTHNCYDGDCICIDIELCPIRTLTAREMRIITKETERLERKEQDNDSVQG